MTSTRRSPAEQSQQDRGISIKGISSPLLSSQQAGQLVWLRRAPPAPSQLQLLTDSSHGSRPPPCSQPPSAATSSWKAIKGNSESFQSPLQGTSPNAQLRRDRSRACPSAASKQRGEGQGCERPAQTPKRRRTPAGLSEAPLVEGYNLCQCEERRT